MGISALLLVSALLTPPLYLSGRQGRAAHRAELEAVADRDGQAAYRLAQGLARKQPRAALRMANQARRLGVHPLRVALLRGDILRDLDKRGEALSAYLEVAEAAPHHAYAHLQLWRLLRDGRMPRDLDLKRVRTTLVEAGYHLAAAPSRPRDRSAARALLKQGVVELRGGRFDAAIAQLEAAVGQDDDDPAVFAALAEAYERAGRARQAEGARRLFVHLDPKDSRLKRVAIRRLDDAERRRGLERDRLNRDAARRLRRSSR